jgi:hypothetical protein
VGYFLPVKRINYKSPKSIAMKSLFIVLLLAAIGVGVYFYFSQKQKSSSSNRKELILGRWKVDSIVNGNSDTSMHTGRFFSALDSSFKNYEVDFQNEGLIFQTHNGEMKDTSHYEFDDHGNLLSWSNNDSVKTKWNIERLGSLTLILKDRDGASFHLRRRK